MEARAVSHPPEDVLLALGSGKLDEATAEAIFFHVEVCPHCLKVAGRLTGDGFLDKLRAARGYSCTPAPSKDLSTVPPAADAASIRTTSELPSPTILPELRDHPQYEVLRELGRGGMGIVYLAKNKLMDRKEVLKVVNKQLLGDAGATERFLREIRSAAQLIHPNIVTAFSALQVGDLLLFSMEYIEGRDLAQVVKSRVPLPAAHSGSYVLQAARGLQHAFEKGMVHRDIKPQNLILDGKKNTVKILDFGLAKATRTAGIPADGLTGMNMMMGTPDYMAPEQARDATNVDIRADIYSLGCTLYCLLAGRAPFVGGSLAMKIAAHQFSEPDAIESLRQDLPPSLAEIVRKMMAKDPAQRYQRPEEVVQALASCFKGKEKRPMANGSPVNVKAAKPVAAPKVGLEQEVKSIHWNTKVAPPAAHQETMQQYPSPLARLKNELMAHMRKKWVIGAATVTIILATLIGLRGAGLFRVKTTSGVPVGKDEQMSDSTAKTTSARAQRMMRWSMKFKTNNGNEYLMQLEGLGAFLAFPVGPNAYKIVDLSKRPYRLEDRDLSEIKRIWWFDNNPKSVESVVTAMGLNIHPSQFIAIIPSELEEDMVRKELAFKGFKEDEIHDTKFEVLHVGGKYVVEVIEQTSK